MMIKEKMIFDAWRTIFQARMKQNVDRETVIDSLRGNISINLSDSKEDKKDEETISPIPQELSIGEQRQALESLRSELLEEQIVGQSAQTDKESVLSKRK